MDQGQSLRSETSQEEGSEELDSSLVKEIVFVRELGPVSPPTAKPHYSNLLNKVFNKCDEYFFSLAVVNLLNLWKLLSSENVPLENFFNILV